MKTFLLRLTPYLISLITGIAIYVLTIFIIEDEKLQNLSLNIASGLLSLPFIFICYEVVNEICSKSINKTLLKHLIFEVNYTIIDTIKWLQIVLNHKDKLNEETIEKFLDKSKDEIKKTLKIDTSMANDVKIYKQNLLNLIYKDANIKVLPDEQTKNLLAISRELGIISKELEHYKETKNKSVIEKSIYELMDEVEDWVEYCGEKDILKHHSFSL